MRTNEKRRRAYARRRYQYEQLRLQAEILHDSHKDSVETAILNRMLNIILDILGERKLNSVNRQAFANHFSDCAYDQGALFTVELGGDQERNVIHLDGQFDLAGLAKRIIWTEVRPDRTLNMENADGVWEIN